MNHFSFKKTTIALAIVTLATALTSCGGSGSNNNAAAVITPTPTPAIILTARTDATAGTASYDSSSTSNRYIYTAPDGTAINLTASGITSGVFALGTSAYDVDLGGTGYTALRYGAYYDDNSTDVTVFATGGKTPTASVPITGTANYTGYAIHNDRNYSTMTYNVDFANRTLSGTGTTTDTATPGATFTLTNGVISGENFTGNASSNNGSGNVTGTFTGGFYGTTAQELGGIARFGTSTSNTAFGGRR